MPWFRKSRDHLRQALAFDELHRVVVDAAFAADRVDGDDVRVVERGGGAGFVLEAGELLLVEHRRERQHLQRDAAAERELLRFVDHAHAAAAELAEDAEVAELRSCLPRWTRLGSHPLPHRHSAAAQCCARK